eukprot:CAMPEP_0179423972 /NCGR_PEP_ID=MMETSP0799-20121207/11316_1 /TAXON_ID=46947 /ORGANISM="Geminigera cryophila, Strain CCMP2564" /LENGTH=189 /DNA_ID=CAMNT_0021198345 /DNA_START=229 /DNA_END=798 /DNA_ORIENTATION=-
MSDVTSLVISCLRRLQGWHMESISNDFCRYSRSNEISPAEHKFVNSTFVSLTKEIEFGESDVLPEWLQGKTLVKRTQRPGGKGGVVQVLNPQRDDEKQPKIVQDRRSAADVNKDRRRFQGVPKALPGQWSDQQVRERDRVAWFANSCGISETEEDFTSCGEDGLPETRLLDALALHKWSDLTPQYRPSL